MIFITGDVHHNMGTSEQSYLDGSEMDVALRYADILDKYDLVGTLFLTGKVVKDNPEKTQTLLDYDHIEVGGHTWSAFQPNWFYDIVQRLSGSPYGPRPIQKWDISHTLKQFNNLGKSVKSWRTHAYRSDKITRQILSTTSVQVISDKVERTQLRRSSIGDLVELPINSMPDHEHIFHGSRDKATVDKLKDNGWKDEFSSDSYPISEWGEIIKNQVRSRQENNQTATILAHPVCMSVADGLETFENICRWISAQNYRADFCKNSLKYVE